MSSAYPPLRPYARGVVPAPTAAEAIAIDRHAIESVGVPQPVLMENAGRAAAAVVARLYPEGPVVGLVGAGNNGGDTLVLLRTLQAWGREVHAVLTAARPADDPLLHGWAVPLTRDSDMDADRWTSLLASAGVVVDGVLGTGARGAPRERQAVAIRRINGCGRPVLAMDLPSGTDASTGAVPGEAVRAEATVAFGAPKIGSLLHPARALVGRLVAVEISFPPAASSEPGAIVATPQWVRARLPLRGTDTHKKAVGSVLVIAGGVGMAGAAILAARAAFRSGAGLVRVCSDPENRAVLQSAVPEAIFVDGSDETAVLKALEGSDAVAAGPGLGTGAWARDVLGWLVAGPAVPTVLDADALNVAAAGGLELRDLAVARPLLLTPHPGEMSRLLGDAPAGDPGEGSPNGGGVAARARAAVSRFGCAVLLKGAPSVVASPAGPLVVDTQGSSSLAVAGMGDALTGACASMLAQGLDAATSGVIALFLTGRAARLAGRGRALVPSDVIRCLPEAVNDGGPAVSDLDLPFVVFDADPAD